MVHKLSTEESSYAVYILASKTYGTLCVGVTSDLINRVVEHRSGTKPGFTSRYKLHRLVYFKYFGEIGAAIQKEKTMKKWPRQWKINLIERDNPHWEDLFPVLSGERRA